MALAALFFFAAACGSGTEQGDEDPVETVASSSTTTSAVGAGGYGGAGGSGSGGDMGGSGGAPSEGGGGFGGSFDLPLSCEGTGPIFATHVLATDYGPGQDFGRDQMPAIALGPPMGGGCCAGGLDVVSLGNGGSIVLGFDGNGIVDGPGPDLLVFENPFTFGQDMVFAELGTVEVSVDGQTWVAFPCTASEAPYGSCAGHTPVLLDADTSALDPMAHGGDAFDLADVGLTEARFIRITDRADLGSVFDLDAVGIVSPACP